MLQMLWRPQAAMALAVVLLALTPAVSIRRVDAAEVSVEIVDFAFSPSAISVDAGDTVVWTNIGGAPHTSTSDAGQAEAWDSGALTTGQRFSHTFSSPGTFTYFCAFHPFMRAAITVRAAPTPTPTPSSTPTASAGTPTATLEPSATSTATPVSPTPTPSVAPPTMAAAALASPEPAPPSSSGGDVLAAAPARANLPSAGAPAASTTVRPGALGAAAALGAAGLASFWWSRRRRA